MAATVEHEIIANRLIAATSLCYVQLISKRYSRIASH